MATYENDLSIMDDLEDHVSAVSKKLMIDIDRRVVFETPVDTASAKRSWVAGVNRSPTEVFDLPGGSNINAAESQAIQQAESTISRAKAFDTIYVVNNQPYIERLNDGWSNQAPSRYVDNIIAQEVARK